MGVRVRFSERENAWYVFVDHENRRRAKKVGPGKAGEKSANDLADVYRGQLALGTFKWEDEARGDTLEKYAEVMRVHWLPALGATLLTDLTREDIKRVLKTKNRTYSRSLVTLMVDVLRGCLDAAVEDGKLATNPAARLGKSIAGRRKEAIEVFTPSDLAHLLEICQTFLPHLYPVVLLLARTGMRVGEALALQVADLDFERQGVWVRRTWGSRRAALGMARFNTPKGGWERFVDLSNQLADGLRAYLHRRSSSSEWLFPSSVTDVPWQLTTFLHQWRRLLRTAGLPYRKPHTLRHTYASILIRSGESLDYVRRQLGHSSIKITVDTYGHLVPGIGERVVNKLDEICKVPASSALYQDANGVAVGI